LVAGREQEGRDPAEVIGVEVRDNDRVDLATRDAERGEAGTGRGTAVEKRRTVGRPQDHRGLATTSSTKGGARADEHKLAHAPALRLSSPQGWKLPPANTPSDPRNPAGTTSSSQTTARSSTAPSPILARAPITSPGPKRVPIREASASASRYESCGGAR